MRKPRPTSPAQMLRRMFFAALAVAGGVIAVFVVRALLDDPVKEYLKRGYIASDQETATLFQKFVREELPPSAQPLLNFAGPSPGAAAVYVLRQDPERRFRLQPLNAAYDGSRDAIFVDQGLLELVKNSPRGTSGRRTLLAFILLHELGHRALHRGGVQQHDFISLPPWEGTTTNQRFTGTVDGTAQDEATRRREDEADAWAVEHYLERLPAGKDGRVNEPNDLPLMNLVEGGLLTELTQTGPYSPILQGPTHPSIFSRVLRFYTALSHYSRFDQETADFYAVEAANVRRFLQHLERNLASVVTLPADHIPIGLAEDGDRLWLLSDRGKIFAADKSAVTSLNPAVVPHVQATDTQLRLPFDPMPDDPFFASGGSLYAVDSETKKLFRLRPPETDWREVARLPDDKVYLQQEGLYVSGWEPERSLATLSVFDTGQEGFRAVRQVDCSSFTSRDESVRLVPRPNGLSALVWEPDNSVRLVSLDGPPALVARFPEVKEIVLSPDGKFAAVSFDRNESAPPAGRAVEFDMLSRPFVRGVDPQTNLPAAIDAGPFNARIAVFDIARGHYINEDVMLSSEKDTQQRPSTQKGVGSGPLSVLQVRGGFLFVIKDSDDSFPLVDSYLSPASVSAVLEQAGPLILVNVPYSRYLLALDITS